MPGSRTRGDRSAGAGPPKRANNAELHGMDGIVTPRAVAYTAAQVSNSPRFSAKLTLSLVALQSYGRYPLDEPL